MLLNNTPLEDYKSKHGLMVKREDLCCPPPGPQNSKMRGILAHLKNRPETVIGVLDNYQSRLGHSVAMACSILGKQCINFYPRYLADTGMRPNQIAARDLGATLVELPAGRSSILYHDGRKQLPEGAYMLPISGRIEETVAATQEEVRLTLETHPEFGIKKNAPIIIPISSGTIAAGVIKGALEYGQEHRQFILYMSFQRPRVGVLSYISTLLNVHPKYLNVTLVEEKYKHRQPARPGRTPEWPCDTYYDLKAFRWWINEGRYHHPEALFWNVG